MSVSVFSAFCSNAISFLWSSANNGFAPVSALCSDCRAFAIAAFTVLISSSTRVAMVAILSFLELTL